MSIISDIETIKSVLGRAINSATSPEFILPYMQAAQDQYFLPFLGQEFLDWLADEEQAEQEVLKHITPALVWYGYMKYLPYSIGSDGDYGLQEESTEKTASVRISVLDKRQRETADNASTAMERFLKYLFEHAEDFTVWTASDEYKIINLQWLKSATEMTVYVPQVAKSYRMFLTLIPYLEKVEKDRVRALVGAVKFDELKTKIENNEALSDDDKKLKEHVQRLVATIGYRYALPFLDLVIMPEGGLRVLSDFDGIYTRKPAGEDEKNRIYTLAQNEEELAINIIKKYLKTGSSNPNKLPDNSIYKTLFRMK